MTDPGRTRLRHTIPSSSIPALAALLLLPGRAATADDSEPPASLPASAPAEPAGPAESLPPASAPATPAESLPASLSPVPTVPPPDSDDLVWDKRWRKFGIADMVTSSAMATGSVFILLFARQMGDVRWRGGILFDDPLRDALRLKNEGGRSAAGRVADIVYFGLIGYPLADALWVVLRREPSDVGLQMLLYDVHSIALWGS